MKNKVVYFIVSAFLILLINGCTSIPTVTGADCKNNIYPEYDRAINYFNAYTKKCTTDTVRFRDSFGGGQRILGCWQSEDYQANQYTTPFTRYGIHRLICGSENAQGYQKCINSYTTVTKTNKIKAEINACGGKMINNVYKNVSALAFCASNNSTGGLKGVSHCISKYQPRINKDREILIYDETH